MSAWAPYAARDLVARARVLVSVSTAVDGDRIDTLPQPTVATVLDVRPALGRIEVLTDHGIRSLDANATVWACIPMHEVTL